MGRLFRVASVVFLLLLIPSFFVLRGELFTTPYSSVLLDRNGGLLGAKIASDGQWRFPPIDSVPARLATAVIEFEDGRFNSHPGVDPLALLRATVMNLVPGKPLSGASTITMQTMRLARRNQPRTVIEKLIEMFLAINLEFRRSKQEILSMYLSQAPYGGNTVGASTASWRYFSRDLHDLTWAEFALLAVLPNAPGLMHPGKNRGPLKTKRDGLLKRLNKKGFIDSTSLELALLESIPRKPSPLPRIAPHLLEFASSKKRGVGLIHSTIDPGLQESVNSKLDRFLTKTRSNRVNNAAVLILESKTGKVLAYGGNCKPGEKIGRDCFVDIIQSPRSSGSILKPFLYGAALQAGIVSPASLVPDVPVSIGGYRPRNFNRQHEGAVPAWKALARSLNVPAIELLRKYGLSRYYHDLRDLGLTTVNRPVDNYGLSIILGSVETNLWEVTSLYAGLARLVQSPQKKAHWVQSPVYLKNPHENPERKNSNSMGPGSAWLVLQALMEVTRPEEEGNWKDFLSSRKVAWKTGTSIGFRDAWSIGTTPEYTVGVWVGNADGEGRPGLVGVRMAAPLMFEVFSGLPSSSWFQEPVHNLKQISICPQSGYLPGPHCPRKSIIQMPDVELEMVPCPWHKTIHLEKSGKYQVSQSCEKIRNMIAHNWFVLPPNIAWFYSKKNSLYTQPPPWRNDCEEVISKARNIGLIYPRKNTKIFIPVDLDGHREKAVFQATHRSSTDTIFWHLNAEYIGFTQEFHSMPVDPNPGFHTLTLVDSRGERLVRKFEVAGKKAKNP